MTTQFPDPLEVQAACGEAGLDVASTQTFHHFAARVCADPELALHATAARDHLFESVGSYEATVARAEYVFGDEAPLLRGLMLVESIRRVRDRQAARGVSAEITRATLERHPYGTLRAHVAEHGRAGADTWIWSWYRTVGSGDLHARTRSR